MPLELSVWVDRSCLRPDQEGRCSIAIELAASGSPLEGERPAARTVLALDVSASMKGEPLAQVIRSVNRMLDALALDGGESATDEVGIVAFSENATRVVEPVRVDAAGKRLVRSRVGRLFAESGTNIEAGLESFGGDARRDARVDAPRRHPPLRRRSERRRAYGRGASRGRAPAPARDLVLRARLRRRITARTCSRRLERRAAAVTSSSRTPRRARNRSLARSERKVMSSRRGSSSSCRRPTASSSFASSGARIRASRAKASSCRSPTW